MENWKLSGLFPLNSRLASFVVNALELSSVEGMEKKRIIRTWKKHGNVLCDSRGTRYARMFDLHVVNRSRLREASPAR